MYYYFYVKPCKYKDKIDHMDQEMSERRNFFGSKLIQFIQITLKIVTDEMRIVNYFLKIYYCIMLFVDYF